MKQVNLLMFDAETRKFKMVQCGQLDDFYDALGCRCFDIVTRRIGEHYYDIYIDDEGLLKANPVLTAVSSDGEVMLVGNLIFANHDEEGETTELTEEEILEITSSTGFALIMGGGVLRVVICDY